MKLTGHLRIAGTVLSVGAMLFNIAETAWFGFNMSPSCPLEKKLDDYSEVLFVYELLLLLVAWLRHLSDRWREM